PDPPRDLQIDVASGKLVHLDWQAPHSGRISGYRLTVVPLSEQDETVIKNINIDASEEFPFTLRDLTPGGSYEIQLQSVYQEKPSNLFLSANFTTKPNTPGRFIVWFRNETTLLVLWQPPYPAGIFDQYKVSIEPKDAQKSVLYVEKESEPPGPAQAAFYGLVPGRAYNISVQTVSHNQISAPTEAQYRTVPLPPTNITVIKETVTSNSFDVTWLPPQSLSEFDRYQVSLGLRSSIPKVITKDSPRIAHFSENLYPGKTYEVVVKTVSGNVASWPVSGNVTTRPLPVLNLTATAGKTGEINVQWVANNNSVQDSYMVKYLDLEAFNSDGSVQVVQDTQVHLENLLDGRNYTITVIAMSKDVSGEENIVYQPTRPAPPVIGVLEAISGKKLNVSWKSDVTSRQDSYKVVWTRNDTKEKQEAVTRNNWLLLENLYPGAGYEIKVSAISFGLLSEPHFYHHTVYPLAPESVQIAKASNATLILTWTRPHDSLIDNYIVRYRPINSSFWREMVVVNATSTEIRDLVAGERYVVRVSTISNKVESVDIQELEQTMYPNSIESVSHILGSYNITFKLATPSGRIDYYIIVYNTVREPTQQNSKQVLASNKTRVGEIVNVVIDGLTPGELYSFRFYAVSHNLRSEGIGVQIRTMPVINSVINIVTDEHETRTLGVKYTPTPRRNVVFDRYRFQLVSDPSIPAQEKLYNDTSRLVIFDHLVPGRLYNISIWTVSGGVHSLPIIREVRLYPEPVRSLSALKTRDTEITLVWEMPYGDKDGYEITYLDPQTSNRLIRNKTFTEKISFFGLKPHQNYSFEVTTISGIGTGTVLRSSPVSQTFTTLESIPGRVAIFNSIDVKPNEITLQWALPPSEQNGILTGFKISYYIKGNQVLKYQLFEPHDTQGTIYNLIPGKTYVFHIQAHTKVGPGHKAVWEEQMPIWPPPSPAENVFATEVSHTSTTIKIRFRKNYFSNVYGPVIAYSVIVSEDYSQDTNTLDLPSWYEVRKKSLWPPYQATEPYYPFNGTVVEDFTIGNEECAANYNVRKYCNGPLKPGATFKVKIRAFTTPEKFTDTVYSYSITTDPDNTALLLGIFLPLSFLLMLAMVVFLLRYKRVSPFRRIKKAPKTLHHINGKEDTMSISESELVTSRPIKLKDFSEHYRIMSADSDFRFSEEFELLKHVGRDKPAGVGRSGTFIALDRILQHITKYDYVDIFGIVYEMRKERVWMCNKSKYDLLPQQQYICIHQCLLCVLEGKEDLLDSPRAEMHDNQGFEGD
ncbi:tyrosine-protein phosphatase 10D-like protein, partial [Dinothrombium tinctorium]